MVIPAGLPDAQQLNLVTKQDDGKLVIREILPVRFSTLDGAEYSDSSESM
jgi:protein-L-isoaspartate(D-aspartate) O-methyltransferase